MITIRKSEDRGHFDHGWLDTYHTFSFGDYHDPQHMGFRTLRVINDDRVAPGQGFGMHPHRDMEIITYIVEGALAHRDSTGNSGVIRPGDVQHMSAGAGISHSEFNASQTDPVRLIQIWIQPRARGLKPSYAQQQFSVAERQARLRLVASPDGADNSLPIHQDVRIFAGLLESDQSVRHLINSDRHAWLQLVGGEIEVNGNRLQAGDGAAISGEQSIEIKSTGAAELLLFDLA